MDEQNSQASTETKELESNTPKKADGNLNAALTYFLGWITGIVFLFTEKEDAFIRFHAAQSTIVFGVLTILSFVPVIQIITGWVGLILWGFLMYKAYSGEKYALPTVGDLAEQLKDQIGK